MAPLTPTALRRLINIWPPFLFSGIKVVDIGADYRTAHVALHQRPYNRNYFGTHFGGSLYSMTDPFYAILLSHLLGKEYNIWDQAAKIDFVTPGRGTVEAKFLIPEDVIARIKEETATGAKYLPEFIVEIRDDKGDLVARVNKTLYVRKKRQQSKL
eukprot:m.39585 g.39585  ORF g.39585 m.39585 type:complete len:156 (+) comp10164_c0_seq1:2578-3045(+)